MNVLQLLPKLNVGGVEKGTCEVARYLTLNGHKAVVVSGGGPLEKKLAAAGVRHYTLPIGKKDPFNIMRCYFKLKEIIKKENINIVHARSRIPALTGYFAAKKTHTKFITTAHGQYRKHLISKVMGWGKIVVVANEMMARYMKDNFGVPLRKMLIVPRGVDLDEFSFIPPKDKDRKIFRVGMISRFTLLKGHLDFIKAVSYVARKKHNVEVILMGDKTSAKEDYIKKLDLAIKRLTLSNVVKFVGSDKNVADVLSTLDVLVSANREQEAFGRSIIEAQSRGVPVVATRIGGVVENITDGENGLFCEPKDPIDMADKILRYAEDPDLAQRVAENARKNVEEKYSLQKTMAMTLDVYRKVLEMKKILVFKISSLGDIILCVPSIRAIRKRYKNAGIKVLVDIRFREVLSGCPYIDEVITCDFKGRDKGPGLIRLARRLREEDFDISVDFQNNRKSHLLAYMSAIPERFGFHNHKLSFLLNRRINMPKKPLDPVRHQSCVLGIMGVTGVDKHLELWPNSESDEWADDFLQSNWLKPGQVLVAFSLSASRKWQSKNWPIHHYLELADRLARDKGIRVVLIGSNEDRELADEFIKKTTAKPIDAVGKTSIPQIISLISKCDGIVTGDSAPMHIAASVGTPFVAIFGPTDPEMHAPEADKGFVMYKKIRCAPCYKPVCSKKNKCLNNVKMDEVFDSLVDVMRDVTV